MRDDSESRGQKKARKKGRGDDITVRKKKIEAEREKRGRKWRERTDGGFVLMWTSADKKPNWVKRRKVEPTPKRDPLWTYVTQTARVPNALTLHPSYIYIY